MTQAAVTETTAEMAEQAQPEEPKIPTVRCSAIGAPCIRKIWYESVSGMEAVFSQDTLRIFEVGTELEPLVVDWLREDGYTVDYNPGSQEAETEIIIPIPGGQISGHHDCIIRRPEGDIMVDIKTMKEQAYLKWKKMGTLEKNLGYAMQVTLYAGAMGLPYAGICGVNKNNSQYHLDVWEFDRGLFDITVARAGIVLDHTEAPVPGSYQVEPTAQGWKFVDKEMETWVCNYCWLKDQGICPGQ